MSKHFHLKFIFFLTLFFALLTGTTSYSLTAKQIQEINENTWTIKISADVDKMSPSAIQYTVFDEDPMPEFVAEIKISRNYYAKTTEKEIDPQAKKEIKLTSMTICWDRTFKIVGGDRIYIVSSKTTPGDETSITSNSRQGKKWIMTKVAYSKGNPICWYIPVQVRMGQETLVNFSATNAYPLETTFDKFINEK